jgi:hypothetical protein
VTLTVGPKRAFYSKVLGVQRREDSRYASLNIKGKIADVRHMQGDLCVRGESLLVMTRTMPTPTDHQRGRGWRLARDYWSLRESTALSMWRSFGFRPRLRLSLLLSRRCASASITTCADISRFDVLEPCLDTMTLDKPENSFDHLTVASNTQVACPFVALLSIVCVHSGSILSHSTKNTGSP